MKTTSQNVKEENSVASLAGEQISQNKGRKRSAENCVDNGGIENDDVFANKAAKRLLLRKTSVREENDLKEVLKNKNVRLLNI